LVYCDTTSGTPFGGAQGGYLPVAKSATQRCENGVAKGLGKAFACILKCHALRASGKLADDTAEYACEANNAGQSCLEKFMGMGAALGSSCPSCLDVNSVAGNVGLLGVLSESLIDEDNGLIYCSPTTTTTTTTTSTTTTTTTTTTSPTTTTTPNLPPCNPAGSACGTCGSGICIDVCPSGTACIRGDVNSEGGCVSDQDCVPGDVCVSSLDFGPLDCSQACVTPCSPSGAFLDESRL
jgi:hypothetical protein